MASALTHAVVAGSIGCCFCRPTLPRAVWITAVVVAILPDADVIGFWYGIPYDSVFGHRGITHSIAFAAALAALPGGAVARGRESGLPRGSLWLFFFLVIVSHGVLDALTNGGLGVAFFAPLWNRRYFFPITPIEVSPLSMMEFLNARGLRILASEARWVWLPSALVAAAGLWFGRWSRPKGAVRAG